MPWSTQYPLFTYSGEKQKDIQMWFPTALVFLLSSANACLVPTSLRGSCYILILFRTAAYEVSHCWASVWRRKNRRQFLETREANPLPPLYSISVPQVNKKTIVLNVTWRWRTVIPVVACNFKTLKYFILELNTATGKHASSPVFPLPEKFRSYLYVHLYRCIYINYVWAHNVYITYI